MGRDDAARAKTRFPRSEFFNTILRLRTVNVGAMRASVKRDSVGAHLGGGIRIAPAIA